jgi:creatinine amidohydrolase
MDPATVICRLGTLSIEPDLHTQVIVSLAQSLVASGHQRIVLLNGHGGNITPVKQALAIVSKRFDASHQPTIALVTYWELARLVLARESPVESPPLSHACEYETSLMLHLFPEKVWMDRVKRAQRPNRDTCVGWEDDEPYRGVTVFKQLDAFKDWPLSEKLATKL